MASVVIPIISAVYAEGSLEDLIDRIHPSILEELTPAILLGELSSGSTLTDLSGSFVLEALAEKTAVDDVVGPWKLEDVVQ